MSVVTVRLLNKLLKLLKLKLTLLVLMLFGVRTQLSCYFSKLSCVCVFLYFSVIMHDNLLEQLRATSLQRYIRWEGEQSLTLFK